MRQERQPASEEILELSPTIRRLQLPIALPGLGHVNCYILEDGDGFTIVDPGLPGPPSIRALRRGLKRAGVTTKQIRRVIVTHSHPDHFGGAGYLQQACGAEVLTHEKFRLWFNPDEDSRDELHSRVPMNMSGPTPWGGPNHQVPWHRRSAYKLMKAGWGGRWLRAPEPTRRLADSPATVIASRELQLVHTPGHTVDHLCLFDLESEMLISGDHVLPTITPHISGMSATQDPLADYFRSLDRVAAEVPARLVLPAHGEPFTNLAERVTEIKKHHEERLNTLRIASDTRGEATVMELMTDLFDERSWGTMAASETYAHLEHLRLAGELDLIEHADRPLQYRVS
ncbi:MAG: MBL fold metallo-hydrolase [Acidimicrobiales bacterium]